MNVKITAYQILRLTMLAIPGVAAAHQVAGESIGWLSGLLHPLVNADHVLAVAAVGLWFAQSGGRWVYLMPFSFAILMLAGGCLALIPLEMAYVESAMPLLVLSVGLMLVFALKLSSPLVMIWVCCFALLHGYTHAADMLLDVNARAYTAGFVLVTVLLNYIGVITGLMCHRFNGNKLMPYLGGMVIVSDVWLAAVG